MVCVLGVDPGVKGGIAFVDSENLSKVHAFHFPTITHVTSSKKKRLRLDLDKCFSIISALATTYSPSLCVFEEVNGFAGNKNSTGYSGFVFGHAFGDIEGMVVSLQVPRAYVPPKDWKTYFKLSGKTKDELKTASRIAASRLFPGDADDFSRVKDDGPAEAALLARYGVTHLLNTGVT